MTQSFYVNCRFLSQNITGVQRFAVEMCRQLKELSPDIKFIAPANVINKEMAAELDVQVVGSQTGHVWEQLTLPRYLKQKGSPVLLNLCNTAPVYYSNNVLVLHDICALTHPEWFSKRFHRFYKLLVPPLVRRAKLLITVSEFSKKEIASYFSYPAAKIKITRNAVDHGHHPGGAKSKAYAFGKYLLAVSSISPRKNFAAILEAFVQLGDPDLDLVLVGENHKSFSKIKFDIPERLKNKIHFLGYVPDDDLIRLYANATAFVYPSLYEGFGIPPLEAMKLGCPTIVSNVTSLPEVCKDGAFYVDPFNLAEMATAMRRITTDEALRYRLREKGYEVAAGYSWAASAVALLSHLSALQTPAVAEEKFYFV